MVYLIPGANTIFYNVYFKIRAKVKGKSKSLTENNLPCHLFTLRGGKKKRKMTRKIEN